jgi:hypothetical protein
MSQVSGPGKKLLFGSSMSRSSQLLIGPGSTVKFPRVSEAVANFVVKRGDNVPKLIVSPGSFLRRSLPKERLTAPMRSGVIFSEPGGDRNRMDGITPMGATRPALYTSRDTEAVLAEGLHYSGHRQTGPVIHFSQLHESSGLWLVNKTIVTFKVAQAMAMIDIRRDSIEGMEFIKEMNHDPAVHDALQKASYSHILQAIQHAADYSACRGLAFAADALSLNGVAWNTARISQHADRFADNVTVTGQYKEAVPQLRPVLAQEYYANPKDGSPMYVIRVVDPTVNSSDVPRFPVGTEYKEKEEIA